LDGFAQKPVSFPARLPGPALVREQTVDLQSTTHGSAYIQTSCSSSESAAKIAAQVASTQYSASRQPVRRSTDSMTVAYEFGEIGGDMVGGQFAGSVIPGGPEGPGLESMNSSF